MSHRWRYIGFYTAHSRKPVLLKLYRNLLKDCILFKGIDMPSSIWLATEIKLTFRQNRNFTQIDDIIKAYEKGLRYKGLLRSSLTGHLESKRELIREAYGQKGGRKIDFLAAYCMDNNKSFKEIVKLYSHNVPIPKEYAEYLESNKGCEDIYERLFDPNYDFKNLDKQSVEHERIIAWYEKTFFRRYQLDCIRRILEEQKRRSSREEESEQEKDEENKEEEGEGEEDDVNKTQN